MLRRSLSIYSPGNELKGRGSYEENVNCPTIGFSRQGKIRVEALGGDLGFDWVSSKKMSIQTKAEPPATQPRTIAFFDLIYETFSSAERSAGGPVDFFCEIGGYTVRLRFAGPALIPYVMPALQHLVLSSGAKPDFNICLWDSVSTRTEMPPPPWSERDYAPRCGIKGFSDDRIQTAFNPLSAILSLCDLQRDLALFWIRDARQLPFFERGAPLLSIFSWWMGSQGRQLVHGGAVGFPEGGALLVGKSGSGKSSTCLRCLDSPLSYAGDDYCLVSSAPSRHLYSLYSSGKVEAKNLSNFPYLEKSLSNAEYIEKEDARFFLHPEFAAKLSMGFPLKAILLPRVTGRTKTTLKKTTAAAALLALAPSTILQLPEAGGVAFKTLAQIAREVPSYVLELGSDVEKIPRTISQLLTSLAR